MSLFIFVTAMVVTNLFTFRMGARYGFFYAIDNIFRVEVLNAGKAKSAERVD